MNFNTRILTAALAASMCVAAAAEDAKPAAPEKPAVPATPQAEPDDVTFELPPRIGLYMKVTSADEASAGTVGASLAGEPSGDYFGGIQFALLGEELKYTTSYGFWLGWLGEVQHQHGLQVSLNNQVWKQANGQIAVFGNYAGNCDGGQIAGLLNSSLLLNGFQISVLGNLADEGNGVQLSGLLNQSEAGSQFQLAVFNVSGYHTDVEKRTVEKSAKPVPGFAIQVGLENFSNDKESFQIGILNSKTASGFQVGLLNFSSTGYFKFLPFINW